MTAKGKDLKEARANAYAATEKAKNDYTGMHATEPLMIIMGNEERGINSSLIKMADELISIPIKGDIESLNVSVAAGVLLYEVVRQRENASK